MLVKIQDSPIRKGDNTGSCKNLVEYLCKENEGKSPEQKELFFSHDDDYVSANEVTKTIDKNKKHVKKDQAKFFSIILSPSQKELHHIGDDSDLLKEYTREAMDEYADNFNKGLRGDDIVYFGKVEYTRSAKGDEKKIKISGEKYKSGELIEGDNRHIHVIVSRKDKSNSKKLSPMGNARGGKAPTPTGKMVSIGFDRSNYFEKCEMCFDWLFEYKRERVDSYRHRNIMKNGNADDKVEEMRRVIQKAQPVDHFFTTQKPPLKKEIGIQEVIVQKNITPISIEKTIEDKAVKKEKRSSLTNIKVKKTPSSTSYKKKQNDSNEQSF